MVRYEVGQVMKIKSWERMAEEYIEDTKNARIITPCGCSFVEEMRKLCGMELEITDSFLGRNGEPRYHTAGSEWTFCNEMIECIIEFIFDSDSFNTIIDKGVIRNG